MRGLQGDFATMPLADLVVYLTNRRAGGTLVLEQGQTRKEVLLLDGAVRGAQSNLPREYLGQFLINLGQLTEDQFHKAYTTQIETQVPIGRILVMIGLVDEAALRHALGLKFTETLLSAYEWREGTFAFDPAPFQSAAEEIELSVELADIQREGQIRDSTWRAIRGTFSRGDLQLAVLPENLPDPPAPGSLEERILALIHDGLSIEELTLALHATDFILYNQLFALYTLGAVKVIGPRAHTPKPKQVGQESLPAEVGQHAERYLAAGKLGEAEMLARRAYEQDASPENADLLKRAEAALTLSLRKELMQPNYVPKLGISPAQVKTTDLSAPERYLLSRVDGVRALKAIVQVSPLRELEALKYFKDFIGRGLVRL